MRKISPQNWEGTSCSRCVEGSQRHLLLADWSVQLALIRRTPDVPVVDPPASKRGPTSLPEALTAFPLITSFVEEKRKSSGSFRC